MYTPTKQEVELYGPLKQRWRAFIGSVESNGLEAAISAHFGDAETMHAETAGTNVALYVGSVSSRLAPMRPDRRVQNGRPQRHPDVEDVDALLEAIVRQPNNIRSVAASLGIKPAALAAARRRDYELHCAILKARDLGLFLARSGVSYDAVDFSLADVPDASPVELHLEVTTVVRLKKKTPPVSE